MSRPVAKKGPFAARPAHFAIHGSCTKSIASALDARHAGAQARGTNGRRCDDALVQALRPLLLSGVGDGLAGDPARLRLLRHIFLFFDHRVRSVADLLYAIFPYWGPTLLGLAWIAERSGGRRELAAAID